MTYESGPLKREIDKYLGEVGFYLGGESEDGRREVLSNLESHIYEVLAAKYGESPNYQQLQAVLAEMDSPESYAEGHVPGDRRGEGGSELKKKLLSPLFVFSASAFLVVLASMFMQWDTVGHWGVDGNWQTIVGNGWNTTINAFGIVSVSVWSILLAAVMIVAFTALKLFDTAWEKLSANIVLVLALYGLAWPMMFLMPWEAQDRRDHPGAIVAIIAFLVLLWLHLNERLKNKRLSGAALSGTVIMLYALGALGEALHNRFTGCYFAAVVVAAGMAVWLMIAGGRLNHQLLRVICMALAIGLSLGGIALAFLPAMAQGHVQTPLIVGFAGLLCCSFFGKGTR